MDKRKIRKILMGDFGRGVFADFSYQKAVN